MRNSKVVTGFFWLAICCLAIGCGPAEVAEDTDTAAPGGEEITGTDGWIELIGESGLSAWQVETGDWFVAGGAGLDRSDDARLEGAAGEGVIINGAEGQTVDLHTREEFGDVEAHVEFMVSRGSNSGIYFQSRYEVQVFDSWGVQAPTYSDCGGIYQRWIEATQEGYEGHAPRVNASLEPGTWQSFDVIFRAPRFDSLGVKTEDARFEKVVLNGQVIHENVPVTGPTRAASFEDEKAVAPLMIQGDHGPVAYRNIKLRRLE